jgi:hypothetical protein
MLLVKFIVLFCSVIFTAGDIQYAQNNGKAYYCQQEKTEFEEAKKFCESNQGRLVQIRDSDEEVFILGFCGKDVKPWIGLRSQTGKDGFKWLDNTTLTTNSWYAGHPTGVGERCGYLDIDKTWMSAACNLKLAFVCEQYTLGMVKTILEDVKEVDLKVAAVRDEAIVKIDTTKQEILDQVNTQIKDVKDNHKLNFNVNVLENTVRSLAAELRAVQMELSDTKAKAEADQTKLSGELSKLINEQTNDNGKENIVLRQNILEDTVNQTLNELKQKISELKSDNAQVDWQMSQVTDENSELKSANSTALTISILSIIMVVLIGLVLLYLMKTKKRRRVETAQNKSLMNGE